jgi:hypothetical protein
LGIDPNDVVYDNPYFQRRTQRQRGCQIDYLIQTRQRSLYLCEAKFSRNPIPPTVAQEITEKIRRLSVPRGMSYHPVLIYAGDLAPALDASNLFTAKIDLGQFLQ